LLEFQRAAGLPADGICGTTTIDSLERVGTLAGDSAAGLRERERLRAGPRRLAGRRVYVAVAPGLAVLGERVTRGLLDAGASALLDATGDDESFVAAEANRYEADLLLALRAGDASGRRCAYFAAPRFTSEVGHEVATEIAHELGRVLAGPPEICGRAYPVLRETRMPAVVCELASDDDVAAMRELVSRAGDAGRAIVRGVERAIEDAVDA
jgi:N-acetylmuramoyl-L-alanine amidase